MTLARCQAAISRATAPPDTVVVVDEPHGAGPAEARNHGVEVTDAEIIVFVDSDVEVHQDAFERIRARFDDDPRLAAVFGSYDDDPAATDLVSRFRNLLHHYVHHEGRGPVTTFWAGLGAVRRTAFLEVGGFDAKEYPVASIEDIEFGMRLAEAGGRIEVDPTIQGKHLKQWTLATMIQTDVLRRGIPWTALLLRRRSAPRELNLGWRHRLSSGAALAVLWGLTSRRPRVAVLASVSFVALNTRFYSVLRRRGGRGLLAAGVGLHLLHHLAALASVPPAIAQHVLRGANDARSPGDRRVSQARDRSPRR